MRHDTPTRHPVPHVATLDLFDAGPSTPATLDEAFAQFDAANPHVRARLAQLALELVGRGSRRVGIGMLFEVLRWEHAMTTDDPASDFKLNNNYRSRYARLLMDEYPLLEGVFETRALAEER